MNLRIKWIQLCLFQPIFFFVKLFSRGGGYLFYIPAGSNLSNRFQCKEAGGKKRGDGVRGKERSGRGQGEGEREPSGWGKGCLCMLQIP